MTETTKCKLCGEIIKEDQMFYDLFIKDALKFKVHITCFKYGDIALIERIERLEKFHIDLDKEQKILGIELEKLESKNA